MKNLWNYYLISPDESASILSTRRYNLLNSTIVSLISIKQLDKSLVKVKLDLLKKLIFFASKFFKNDAKWFLFTWKALFVLFGDVGKTA